MREAKKAGLWYVEYLTKMTRSLHLFGHRPQKRSQEARCEEEKVWYKVALTTESMGSTYFHPNLPVEKMRAPGAASFKQKKLPSSYE